MPADVLVRVVHALIEGLVVATHPHPELFPTMCFYEAFAALAPRQR
jgi:hypothetical protein